MKRLTIIAAAAMSLAGAFVLPAQAQVDNQRIPESQPEEHCGDSLGYLRQVHPAEIAAVDSSYQVWVTEVCPEFSLMRSDGNAAGLRKTIGQNPVLVEALQAKAFTANDVFAVRMMGEGTVNLFVHHFTDYR